MAVLTVRSLDTLSRQAQEGGTDRRVPDGKVPGLYAAVRPSGRITFQLRYQAERGRHGRQRVVSLGVYGPGFTLEQARKRAEQLRGEVVSGKDPAAARDETMSRQKAVKAQRARAKHDRVPREALEVTGDTSRMSGAVAQYLTANAARFKKSTHDEWQRLWLRDVAPVLGGRRVADITPLELQSLHASFYARPIIGNRVLTFLSAFFTWAETIAQLRPLGSHPVLPLRAYRYREAKKERVIARWEYRRLAKAMKRSEGRGGSTVTLSLIRFLALSGWRESEGRTLKWEYLDFTRGTAALPDTKGGAEVRVLGRVALNLLDALPREAESPFVFPGRKEKAPLQEPKRAWASLREAARLPDVVLHTMRHTFITEGIGLGYHDAVIGKLVGHRPRGSTTASRYTHLETNAAILRKAADETAARVAALMTLHSEAAPT